MSDPPQEAWKAWNVTATIREAMDALRSALANSALDKMAENEREFGIQMEPERQEPFGHGGRPMTLRECMEAEEPSQAEPAAWKHDCAALLMNDVELWVDSCPHCGRPRTLPQAPVVPPHREPQEPVECMCGICKLGKREPLTDEEITTIWRKSEHLTVNEVCRAIEAAHGIKE
jgi:hypothetical protein